MRAHRQTRSSENDPPGSSRSPAAQGVEQETQNAPHGGHTDTRQRSMQAIASAGAAATRHRSLQAIAGAAPSQERHDSLRAHVRRSAPNTAVARMQRLATSSVTRGGFTAALSDSRTTQPERSPEPGRAARAIRARGGNTTSSATNASDARLIQRRIHITDDPNAADYDVPAVGNAMQAEVVAVVYPGHGDLRTQARARYHVMPDDVQQVLHGLSLIDWRGTAEALRQRVLQDAAATRFFRTGAQPQPPEGGAAVPPVTRLYRSMGEAEFVQLRRAIAAAEAAPPPPNQATVRGARALYLSEPGDEGRIAGLVRAADEARGRPTAPTGHLGGIPQANHHFGVGREPKYLVEFKLSWPRGGAAPPPVLLAGAMDPHHVYPQAGGHPGSALGNVNATRAGRPGAAKQGEGYPDLPARAHHAVGLKAEDTAGERLSVATAPNPSTHGLERLRHLAPPGCSEQPLACSRRVDVPQR